MTKRKMLAVIIALVLSVLIFIAACSAATADVQNDDLGGFILVKTNYIHNTISQTKVLTVYDPDTMVMYALFSNSYGLTITRLDNADGTPKLYSPEN